MEPEGSYWFCKSLSPVLILSQKNSIRTTPLDFFKIPSSLRLRLPSCLISSGFLTNVLYIYFSSVQTCYMSCPSSPPSFNDLSNNWSEVEKYSSSICCSFPSSRCFCYFRPNVFLSTLFSNTLILHSHFNVRDQFSHSHRRTD